MSDVVLRVDALAKTFRKPFTGAKVEAVRGVSLEVRRGEIFGFLGPNGAGKTTTIKMLTGLIAPTSGTASIFGVSSRSPDAMAKVGFLPENPYVYPYLTPREFVTMCARLSGVGGPELAGKVERVVQRLGVGHAIDRAVRSFSKGMLQRVGIAAALVHDPELLVFDEPMSGLDPIGRKEVRDLIVEEKARGRTVFFSSHILSDVEMLCDRVCILEKGLVALAGAVRDLVEHDSRRREIAIAGASAELEAALAAMGYAPAKLGELVVVDVDGEAATRAVIERVYADGARIESVIPKRETLEALFMRRAASERPAAP